MKIENIEMYYCQDYACFKKLFTVSFCNKEHFARNWSIEIGDSVCLHDKVVDVHPLYHLLLRYCACKKTRQINNFCMLHERSRIYYCSYFRSESDHYRDNTALKVNNFHLLD